MKRIALFLDGTWNEPGDNTNVWRTKLMLADQAPDGIRQVSYYHEGVGSRWYNRLRGGAFARGLSQNIREAYQWLMEHFDEGDEVFIFGFSRGAYTARSLAGMIARCGLLCPGAPLPVIQVFERYKQSGDVTPLYTLEYQQRRGREDFSLEEQWLLEHSVRIPIKFIGVWDTVGTLGVPFGHIPGISRRTLYFHNTRLSKIFQRACQALAVDEHRKPYMPTLWTKFTPKHADKEDAQTGVQSADSRVEQRWFVGAHSNIGGGYRNDPLALIPLAWLQEQAAELGLHFRTTVELKGNEHLSPVVDSYARFLNGFYRALTLGRRFHREIGRSDVEKEAGVVSTVNEMIDPTVFDRWRAYPRYRPKSVTRWARSQEENPAKLVGAIAARR